MNDQDARDLKLGRVVRGLIDALEPRGCRGAVFPFMAEQDGLSCCYYHVSLTPTESDLRSDPEAVVRQKLRAADTVVRANAGAGA